VHAHYRSQLKAFSKQQFDPFRRRERIIFELPNQQHSIETTVGQLNFFRWAIESGVLQYVVEHKVHIERDMCAVLDAASAKASAAKEGHAGDGEADDDKPRSGTSSSSFHITQFHDPRPITFA
jgi:hypothetical protein